jgi:two-component system sensor histidine kinase/response regulator
MQMGRNLPIQRKLALTTLLASGIALVLAGLGFIAYEIATRRTVVLRDALMTAEMVGKYSSAELSFEDAEAAERSLKALAANQYVIAACVYKRDGKPFARFQSNPLAPPFQPPPHQAQGNQFGSSELEVFQPIVHEGEPLGTVYLRLSLRDMHERLWRYCLIAILVLIIAGSLSLGLAATLQRSIIHPITELVQATDVLIERNDYSVRASKGGNDELGRLVDGFNKMVAEIQERDSALRQTHSVLEDRVRQRTEELTESNQRLRATLQEAERLALKAQEASRVKSEFLANMSHEIRTPMNGILGFTNLLIETPLTEEQRDFAQTVKSSAEGLLTIINDILDLSKLEAGKLNIEEVNMQIASILEEVMALLAERAGTKQLDLLSLVRSDVPPELRGDPVRFRQILLNLAGNAIKFTERGEILVDVSLLDESPSHVRLKTTVQDTGVGISEDALARLFNAFQQADNSTTRKYGGTGLGLVITKQLVNLMGGEIHVESTLGKGSTFTFTVQLARTSQQPPAQSAASSCRPWGPRQILIVTPSPAAHRVLRHHFDAWGLVSSHASNPAEAWAALEKSWQEEKPFSLVVADGIKLPDPTWAFTERLKADPRCAALKVLLLIPINARFASVNACPPAGIPQLRKPLRIALLREQLQSLFQAPLEDGPAQWKRQPEQLPADLNREAKPSTLKPLTGVGWTPKILLVDDNAVNRKLAAGFLRRLGHEPEIAHNGLEAISIATRAHCDLILMDCQMPEMDGYAASREIRRWEQSNLKSGDASIRIIALTAHAMAGDEEKCLAAGMDDYLTKPIAFSSFAAKLEEHLQAIRPSSSTPAEAPSDPPGQRSY